MYLGDQRTIGTVRDGCCCERRNFGETCHLRKDGHIRSKCRKVDVPDQLEQPTLMINQEHDSIVGVNHPLVKFSHCFLLSFF